MPGCKLSKSSTEKICELHTAARANPLPKTWICLDLENDVPVYLDFKNFVAQYDHPGAKGETARPRTSKRKPEKPRKGYPLLFCVEPQPTDLPEEWEEIFAFAGLEMLKTDPDNVPAPTLLYFNTSYGTLQAADPRPPPEDEEILPSGWRKGFDVDGDPFYIDDNSDIFTYDDPRLVEHPTPSLALRAMMRPKGLHRKRTGSRKAKVTWKLAALNVDAFSALDNVLSYPADIPAPVRNKTYNRYMDIIPNPSSVVKLAQINGDVTTEYINANYIRSYDDEPRAYIAAQGPLPHTVGHFWRMIWENKVTIIVMVTGLVEKGAVKCERYWPKELNTPQQFDGVAVTNIGYKAYRGYVAATLRASVAGETRTVNHLWFTGWPDHGVPRTPTGLIYTDDVLELLKHVRTLHKKQTSPVLVHCSAGIGRTGTFIAIDHAMALLEHNTALEPLDVIASIRRDRCALVQHANQYEFLHEACIRFADLSKRTVLVAGESVAAPPTGGAAAAAASPEPPADMSEVRAREKAEAAQRVKEVSSRGGRARLLSFSQVAGELRTAFRGEMVSFVDVDGDGRMDWREAQLQGMSREAFDALDTNKDGVVTMAEFREYQTRHTAAK